MKTKKRWIALHILLGLSLVALIVGLLFWGKDLYVRMMAQRIPWGYARQVSAAEQAKRDALLSQARQWLGTEEGTQAHRDIIDLYNAHEPLAQGYVVKYEDNWCDTFVSAMAISCGYTDFIPTECGCQRHIALLEEMGCWVEDDGYVPLPGDLIFYSSQDKGIGDCTAWSDHVGIVLGTYSGYIRVIEGNYNGRVDLRVIAVNGKTIRGFGTPNYME